MSEIVIQMAINWTFTLGFPTFRGHHVFAKNIFVYIDGFSQNGNGRVPHSRLLRPPYMRTD